MSIRNHIVLLDQDGDLHFHGIAIAPESLSCDKAKAVISQCYEAAKNADPDGWDFGQVMERIAELPGWDVVIPNDEKHDLWIE